MEDDPEVISDYYVYVHTDPNTGTPFYVGKGRGNRAYDKLNRSDEWKSFVESLGGAYIVNLHKENLLEHEALYEEAALIEELGKRVNGTGPLINWTDGGRNELGNIGFSISIPGLQERYENFKCRMLRGEERKKFASSLASSIDKFRDAIDSEYEDCDEDQNDEPIECAAYSFWEEVYEFQRQKLDLKHIAISLDSFIYDLECTIEDHDFIKKDIMKAAVECLDELISLNKIISYRDENGA